MYFSFDGVFIPRAAARLGKTIKWKHEDASEKMLDAAITDAGLNNPDKFDDYITPEEIRFVKELINPERYPVKSRPNRAFLYDIVSNSRCSVDVDKFDYLLRDSANVGVKVSFDPRRLMRNCRVIDNQICFQSKDVYLLYDLFLSRYSMFKQVYSHRVGKAIEFMISDILLLAEDHFKFTECIDTPEKYLRLTDCILRDIENSTASELQQARDLIGKLRRRQLYKMAGETIIPIPTKSDGSTPPAGAVMKQVTEADIIACRPAHSDLCESDIIVHNMTLNFAMKDKNPVDNILFYKANNPDKAFKIPQSQVSLLTPSHFQEKYVRVFVRDPANMADARTALNNYMQNVHNSSLNQADVDEVKILSQQSRVLSPRKSRLVPPRTNTFHLADSSDVSASQRQMILPSTPVLPATSSDGASGLSKRGKSVSFRMEALDAAVDDNTAETHGVKRTATITIEEASPAASHDPSELDQALNDSFSQMSQSQSAQPPSQSFRNSQNPSISSQLDADEPAKKKKKPNQGNIKDFFAKK